MHSNMEEWLKIRQRVLVEGVSKRATLRETGLHWQTLEKVLSHGAPPGYRLSQARERPKIGPYLDRIQTILEEDKQAPKKQRHTAKRLLARLRQEGYTGGYTQVKLAVRELRARSREVFLPLLHRPGEAQVDFGFALAKVAGELRQVVFFVMALPHSDAFFVQAPQLTLEEEGEEAHQAAHFVRRAVPVLCREGVEGEVLDAVVREPLNYATDVLRARAVAGETGPAAAAGPAAVAIHDDGYVLGHARKWQRLLMLVIEGGQGCCHRYYQV